MPHECYCVNLSDSLCGLLECMCALLPATSRPLEGIPRPPPIPTLPPSLPLPTPLLSSSPRSPVLCWCSGLWACCGIHASAEEPALAGLAGLKTARLALASGVSKAKAMKASCRHVARTKRCCEV